MNRRAALSSIVSAFALCMMAIQAASLSREAAPGATFAAAGSCSLSVVSTAFARPTVPLIAGDMLALNRMTPDDRILATQDSGAAGDRINYRVVRAGTLKNTTERILTPEPPALWIPAIIVKIVTLLVGLLLLWRGRDRASLHYGLASTAFAIALFPVSDGALSPYWRNVYESLAQVLAGYAAYALYLTFEDLSAGSIPGRALAACRAVVAASALIFSANAVSFAVARATTGCFNATLYDIRYPALVIALVVMFGVLAATYFRASGVQRQRVRWLFWSTIIGFSGVITWLLIPSLRAAVLTSVVITIGYAYAILRHRVIDVGFVINRAIVFTTVTTIVFGIFAVIGSFVESMTLSRNDSVIVQSIAALVLAFSFDFGYKRVEELIDRIFFRDRRAAVVAVRQFIDDAHFINRRATLLERAVAAVYGSIRPSGAAIYLEQAQGYALVAQAGAMSVPARIDGDDPIFVRLRTYLKDADLADALGALGSNGHAFAMALQTRLLGAVVLGNRENGETYDPEERELLRLLAREVATALVSIDAAERAGLVAQLAEGTIDEASARVRARAFIAGTDGG